MGKKRSSLNPWILILIGAAVLISSYVMNERKIVGPFTIFGAVGGLFLLYGLLKKLFTRKKVEKTTYDTAHEKQSSKNIHDRTYRDAHRQSGALYCHNCGAKVHPASNFCPYCGSRIVR